MNKLRYDGTSLTKIGKVLEISKKGKTATKCWDITW